MMSGPSEGDLSVWWIPQVPMDSFNVPVTDIEQALFVMETLAEYDRFQFENRVKGDYCNAGGLNVWDAARGEWCEWEDEDGNQIDDIRRSRWEDVTI